MPGALRALWPRARRQKEHEWLEQSWADLKGLLHATDLDRDERKLVCTRWLKEAQHYDEQWREKRIAYSVFGVLTVAAGLATPLFAAFGLPKWTLALAGFIAALAGSIEGFFRFGERWRQQRRTAMLLKAEGLRFLELRLPYRNFSSHKRAFPAFIERLERINEAQSEEYLALLSRELDARDLEAPGTEPGSGTRGAGTRPNGR